MSCGPWYGVERACALAMRLALFLPKYWATWVGLCETANTWWSSDRRVHELAEIHGLENLHAALAKGRGAIMIGGHFTTIEIATRILGTVVPLNVVYRPMKNAVLSHTMFTSFSRHGKPIAYDDIRTMVRALKKNETVR